MISYHIQINHKPPLHRCRFQRIIDLQEGRGNLESEIETLLNVEKRMRLNSNDAGLKSITKILKIYSNARASKILDVHIVLLYKLHGQFKQQKIDAVDNGINQYGTDQPPK